MLPTVHDVMYGYGMATVLTRDVTITCPTCHGEGKVPGPDAVLARLKAAGERRAAVVAPGAHPNRHSVEGRRILDEADAEIRELVPEAARVGIKRAEIADAVGVATARLYTILGGKTGA